MTSPLDLFDRWTPAEDRALRRAYSEGGLVAARAALPRRSDDAIFRRAQRLGVTRRRRWTAEDDRRLRVLWSGEWTLRSIAAQLHRTELTTYWRAQKLGLSLGCPPGWERISHAAARCGYGTGQLRAILRWAEVDIQRAITRPTKRRGKKTSGGLSRIVWPADVDLAVERWHETEPLEAAARRVGMCAGTLARRLAAIGVHKPAAGKARWRVSEEAVRAALQIERDWHREAAKRRKRGVAGRFAA
jgi:AraC-like DNA-binding protein